MALALVVHRGMKLTALHVVLVAFLPNESGVYLE
jgi:hypothetical protein